jgi:mutator protein MutT
MGNITKKVKNKKTVQVGLGVIIVNDEGKILIGKRKGLHVPYYSIPGGKLDTGETFEQGATREVKEETNLDIKKPQVIGITNNLTTYKKEGLHFISIILLVKEFSGELKAMEPEKCAEWMWVEPTQLPEPHFEASQIGVEYYLGNKFYKKNN